MQKTIEQMLAVKKLDLELDEIREGQKTYPIRLFRVNADYEEKRKSYEVLGLQVEALDQERLALEDTLRLEEQRLRKSKMRINEIKTNYEYQAMRREIENTERSNKELEEQILNKTEELENLKKTLLNFKEGFGTIGEELEHWKKETLCKTAEYEEILKTKETELRNLEAQIDRSILAKYRLIRKKRHQDAIVPIVNGSCQGCFMNIPPQMLNDILRQVGIYQCPNCQRLIYPL